jgi:RHS repeat-associated protein
MTAIKTGVPAAYTYDPLGRRTKKSGTGVTAAFFVDSGTDEIAEYCADGTVLRRFIPGPGIDQPIAMLDYSVPAPKCSDTSFVKTFFHENKQGSVIAMSGASAALTEGPYTYDTYGNCFSGGVVCGSAGEPYRFTGRRLDPETGLLYYRARYYDPKTGRFNQTDPVGYAADLNLYAYVGNDPTDKTDPKGEETQWSIGLGGTAALVLGVSGSVNVGISVPTNVLNVSGYQGFVTAQGSGMVGTAGFLGAGLQGGVGHTQGALPTVSTNVTGHVEVDVGKGPSVGASAEIGCCSKGGWPTISSGSISGGRIGAGVGAYVGVGGTGSVTAATPTVGQMVSGLKSLLGGALNSEPKASQASLQQKPPPSPPPPPRNDRWQ